MLGHGTRESRDLPGQPDYSHLGESSGMLMDLDGWRARCVVDTLVTAQIRAAPMSHEDSGREIVGAEGFEPSLWTV